jgi:hypothetical protein
LSQLPSLSPARSFVRPQKLRTADAIPPSTYQTFLSSNQYDEEQPQQSAKAVEGEEEEEEPQAPRMEKTRYWSDYNRVYYHPRTMNPLPGVFRRLEKGEEARGVSQGMGGWGEGKDAWEAGLAVRPSSLVHADPSSS